MLLDSVRVEIRQKVRLTRGLTDWIVDWIQYQVAEFGIGYGQKRAAAEHAAALGCKKWGENAPDSLSSGSQKTKMGVENES